MFYTDIDEFKVALQGIDITSITSDSRKVVPGSVFFAIRGHVEDGHSYIENAKRRGAIALVTESFVDCALPTLVMADIRHQASGVAHRILGFDYPSLVGVTGTNGKSTISTWIATAQDYLGLPSAVIGTLGVLHLPTKTTFSTGLTTPGAVEMQSVLAQLSSLKTDCVSLEVSSHALDQGRVADLPFKTAIFANLSRDHLDYHLTMDDYFESKAKLFTSDSLKTRIINGDDEYGQRLLQRYPEAISYGFASTNRVVANDVKFHPAGMAFSLIIDGQSIRIETAILGRFNVQNLLAVAAQLNSDGYPIEKIGEALSVLKPVSGRMEQAGSAGLSVIVDYAHTPDALTQILASLTYHTNGKLWCVFGCGGDRDRGKRSEMAAAVEASGAIAILTSDNPRTEDPRQIINDAQQGFDSDDYYVIESRSEAIQFAIKQAAESDLVVIAGKGHEDYLDVDGKKLPWSEFEQIRKAIALRMEASQ
ncbi:UDP-N-acetylmuramoyl-L-alanyl-D-glutamate--2,6-diaminopimelate ligase [uncultured Umboniibacter sp.]|uniref:UDP-N-acetylmuramoyl-L-alanyl-D-glutamate--2, 6-diaminopimelate ligase n=1 Tax=uncultured Umboniibacter sp. TaxID=1798917 RepID=UPI00262BDC2B|nr:UDP-N-acetylmuramoyl-L-alanyl-D-glutamate--2,6-diaminopimelate ligase [uncultured Umboniibacter sp.]